MVAHQLASAYSFSDAASVSAIGGWSQRLPGDGDSIRNDPRHAGAPAYGWPRPSVPAAGEQVTAGLQLDQAENLGTLNVTVVLRPLVLGESPLVGTASQLLNSRLDVGVNARAYASQ